jgi:hypothetical protein
MSALEKIKQAIPKLTLEERAEVAMFAPVGGR